MPKKEIKQTLDFIKKAEKKTTSGPKEDAVPETGYFEPLVESPEIPINETATKVPITGFSNEFCGKNMEILELRLGREFDNKFNVFENKVKKLIEGIEKKIPGEAKLVLKVIGLLAIIATLIGLAVAGIKTI